MPRISISAPMRNASSSCGCMGVKNRQSRLTKIRIGRTETADSRIFSASSVLVASMFVVSSCMRRLIGVPPFCVLGL